MSLRSSGYMNCSPKLSTGLGGDLAAVVEVGELPAVRTCRQLPAGLPSGKNRSCRAMIANRLSAMVQREREGLHPDEDDQLVG